MAPLTSSRRRLPLPRLEMPPRRLFPPVAFCRGASPIHAAKSRKLQQSLAFDRAHNDDIALGVGGMNLKDFLRRIEPDARDRRQFDDRLARGWLSFDGFSTTSILARLMTLGCRPPHHRNA